MTKDRKIGLIIIIFIAISAILMLHHRAWRDEGQAWLIARDSPDLSGLIHRMTYEGTPALWHLLLWPLAQSGLPYSSMAVLHFLLILAAVIVFAIRAPFSRFQKILFVCGYYILYEYNIIARSYVLTVLFLFLLASLYKERFRKPLAYSLLIFFLSNSNLHSLIVAMVLAGVYFFELVASRESHLGKRHLFPLLIISLGFLVSIYQLWPLHGGIAGFSDLFRKESVVSVLYYIVAAFVPIPQLTIQFWNTNLLCETSMKMALLGVPLFLFSVGSLMRKPKPLLIYLLSSAGFFSVLLFTGFSLFCRHAGLLFIVFIFSLWIAEGYGEEGFVKRKAIGRVFGRKRMNYFFTAVLFFQAVAAGVAVYYEAGHHFSAGEDAADFIKKGFLNKETLIVAYPSEIGAAILPYLPKPYAQFYYIEHNGFGSFTAWEDKEPGGEGSLAGSIEQEARKRGYKTILIVLSDKLEDVEKNAAFTGKYRLAAHFDKTISDESFYIYRLKESSRPYKKGALGADSLRSSKKK